MGVQQKTIDAYKRMKALVNAGESVEAAAKTEGKTAGYYYYAKGAIEKKPGKKITRLKRKQVNFVDVPLVAEQSTKVAVVICNAENLKNVLAGLQ